MRRKNGTLHDYRQIETNDQNNAAIISLCLSKTGGLTRRKQRDTIFLCIYWPKTKIFTSEFGSDL